MTWHVPQYPSQETPRFQAGDSGGYDPVSATPFYLPLNYATPLLADPPTTAPTAGGVGTPTQAVAGRVRHVHLQILRFGTNASAQSGTLDILVNNTTATTAISGVTWNEATGINNLFSDLTLNIPLPAGCFWTVRITPPTWTTTPTVTFYVAKVVVSYP